MIRAKRLAVTMLVGLAFALPGCDYVVEGFQDGVEDYLAETTRTVLDAILPIKELVGADEENG